MFYFLLSAHLCLCLFLGLFEFDFHAVISPISYFSLHTCPTQHIHTLFKVLTMLNSLYQSSMVVLLRISYFPSLFRSRSNMFLNIFVQTLLTCFIWFFVTEVFLAYRATGLNRTLYIFTLEYLDNIFDLNNDISP